MSKIDDINALELLERAVYKAQASLEKTKHFQPFLMLRTDEGEVEFHENDIEDVSENYTRLELMLQERIKKEDVDIIVLVVDTEIPDNISEDFSQGMRLHLEEKSQRDKVIGARFIYVPYELFRVGDSNISVKLHTPIPVGFPAEYI